MERSQYSQYMYKEHFSFETFVSVMAAFHDNRGYRA